MPLGNAYSPNIHFAIQYCGFSVVPGTIGVRKSRRAATSLVVFLVVVSCLTLGCSHPGSNKPTTISFVDPEWSHDLTARNILPDERLQEFTRQTGITVKHLPTPEPALDQLAMARQLLGEAGSSPDVVGVDVIWPGVLSQDLIDLRPHFATELSSLDPDVVASYTVKGKLVAVPFHSDIGVLFYRKDLLREYGYGEPPQTWDQLEKMAVRIQQGERAKGHKDFWGFAWPGAAGEGLTCNALEWQLAEGGGAIIEADDTISVNNLNTIRSWQRAAHWIGWISTPNVLSYQEWDAVNAFYKGKAAFFRGWARSYSLSVEAEANPAIRDTSKISTSKIGIATVPGTHAAQAATLGGFGLGVSQSTVHPAEALELVRFLLHREMEFETDRAHQEPTKQPEVYDRPNILKSDADFAHGRRWTGIASRPSTLVGQKYDDVDRAYIQAVHAVLTGKTGAPEAATELETELKEITGFKTGPPSSVSNPHDESAKARP